MNRHRRPPVPSFPSPGPWLIAAGTGPDGSCAVVARTTTRTETMIVLRALIDAGLNPQVRSL